MDDQTGDGTFELPPRRVGNPRRPWVAVLAVAGAALAIVLVAALSGGAAGPAGDVAGRPSGVDATVGPPSLNDVATGVAGVPRGVPDSVTCHHVDRFACRLAVSTALGTLTGDVPAVAAADVWSGLVCGDTLDCPNGRLADATVAGSAVIDLVDDGTVWVNVTRLGPGRYDAWVIRSRSRG